MSVPRTVFRRIRGRARVGIVLEGAALLLLAFGAFAFVSFAVDRSLHLETGYRLALLLGLAVALGHLLYSRILRPLSIDLNDEEMALAVERADPGVKQALISAVQFEEALGSQKRVVESRDLMCALVQTVEQHAAQMDTGHAVDGRRMARFGGLLAVTVLALAAWAALAPDSARLWAVRNLGLSSIEWPRYTSLAFGSDTPAVVRVPEGDDLTLSVTAVGIVPEEAFLHYAFDGGDSGIEAMTATGDGGFSFTLKSVLENAVVHATGGDGSTPELRIETVARSRIDELQLTLVYPAYMGKDNETAPVTAGDVDVPQGGALVLSGRSSKRLASAQLTFATNQRVPMEVAADGHSLSGRIEPLDSGLLTLNVIDLDRLDSNKPPQIYVRLVEDRSPSVDFRPSGVGSILTPIARVPGTLKVSEDYGLDQVSSQFRVSGVATAGASAEDTPWKSARVGGLESFKRGETTFEGEVAFDLKPLHPDGDPAAEGSPISAGQFVSLRFSARDNFGPGDPHIGESDAVVFQIVTRQELMADLSRRQGEQRRELELVVARERSLLAEIREVLSPAADDPRAAAARLSILTVARAQRALGQRTRSVADSYRQILDEYFNNRALEPGNIGELRGLIQEPLERLAADEFPASAAATQDFAQIGRSDLREVASLSYESIIARLEQVLEQMEEAETFAALLEGLRQTIKLQNSAIREAEARRSEEAKSLFGPPTKKPGGKKRDGREPK